MKNWIFISIFSLLEITTSNAQNNDFQILMPAINPLYADSAFPAFNIPPINQHIPTQGNGSRTISNPGFRSSPTTTITDEIDVVVHASTDPQTEPHLTINKNHPNNIIISCNYDYAIVLTPPFGSFKHDQSIFINDDFNNPSSTWNQFQFYPPGALLVWGDPSTAVDADGNLFAATVNSNADDYWINKSTDLGSTWLGFSGSNPLDGNASGPLSSMFDLDKEMIVSDNLASSPYKNNVYCVWMDHEVPPCTVPYPFPVKYNMLDVVHGATTFSSPIFLSHRYGQGANIQTSRDGHVYVCWADYEDYPCIIPWFHAARHIGFTKSTDGGQTFLPGPNDPALYQINYNGIRYGPGGHAEYNLTKINDFPVMAVDRSCGGPFSKRIYITYSEFDPVTSGKSRIIVIYSDNEGFSWTKANSTNNSYGIVDFNGELNWMPWITVDDATGNVYIAYVLAQNYASGGIFPADVYLAYSVDGGATFDNIKVSDGSFTPYPLPDQNSNPPGPFTEGYWGDYISVDAYGGNVYVAWMSNHDASPTTIWQYNIYCSKVTVSTPLIYSSFLDLPINGPLAMTNTQSNILYEAVNSITTVANQENITIANGADVTFKAGNFIHFKPGSSSNNFGSLLGSKTHAYIASVSTCTTPFRLGNVIKSNSETIVDKQNNLVISPNPFTSVFDINYSVYSDSKITIQLFDAFGRKLIDILNNQFTESGNYYISVNAQSYSEGIYYIKMSSENKSYSKKLIKL